jgi:hypothetical protein
MTNWSNHTRAATLKNVVNIGTTSPGTYIDKVALSDGDRVRVVCQALFSFISTRAYWSFQYLAGSTGDDSNGMAGFSVGNSQYVYYVYAQPPQ